MVVGDIFDVYKGEIRVYNDYYEADIGIVNTIYNTWVKNSYRNCEVVKLELEMLNTAVLSSRVVLHINDEEAGQDTGDVEEATKKDIQDLIDGIYVDEDDNGMTEDEETIRIITEDYEPDTILPGTPDTECEEATDQDVQEVIDNAYPNTSDDKDDEEEEATDQDINDLMAGLYND